MRFPAGARASAREYPGPDGPLLGGVGIGREYPRAGRAGSAGLDVLRHVWDKRETSRLAEQLSIPIPRPWFPRAERDLTTIDADGPFAVKPAIKENFFYHTHVKAWRANDKAQLAAVFRRAAEI